MKTWSNLSAAVLVSVLALGVAGCANHSDKRGMGDTGEVVSDSWITTKVKSQLVADKEVSASHIHVKTVDGVVTLSGKAKTQEEATRAVQDAQQIKGVKSVVNEIEMGY